MSDRFITAADLLDAYAGREADGLAIVRDVADKLEDVIRHRLIRDASLLGIALPTPQPTPQPAAKKSRPEPPESDADLRTLLLAELDKGEPLSVASLARRTGAPSYRIKFVLRATPTAEGLKVNGLRWSRARDA